MNLSSIAVRVAGLEDNTLDKNIIRVINDQLSSIRIPGEILDELAKHKISITGPLAKSWPRPGDYSLKYDGYKYPIRGAVLNVNVLDTGIEARLVTKAYVRPLMADEARQLHLLNFNWIIEKEGEQATVTVSPLNPEGLDGLDKLKFDKVASLDRITKYVRENLLDKDTVTLIDGKNSKTVTAEEFKSLDQTRPWFPEQTSFDW